MGEDLENIGRLIRDYVHLRKEEIEGFIEGSLDPESLRMVEEHLSSCVFCSNEMELIKEVFSQEDAPSPGAATRPPGKKEGLLGRLIRTMRRSEPKYPVLERLALGPVVPKVDYRRLWIGDMSWNLKLKRGNLFEIENLSGRELSAAHDEDKGTPGRRPVGIEGPGTFSLVLLLSAFERKGDFVDFSESPPEKSPEDAEEPFRFYVPSLPDSEVRKSVRLASTKPDTSPQIIRSSALRAPEPEIIMCGETKDHKIEFLQEKFTRKILVKIIKK